MAHTITLLLMLFAITGIETSYAGQADSLIQEYRLLPENERASYLNKMVMICGMSQECHQIIAGELEAEKSPDLKYYCEYAGIWYTNNGQYETSRIWYRRALAANSNDHEYEGLIYNLIANGFQKQDPGDSLIYYREKALEIMDPAHHYSIWQVYFWIGQDWILRGQYDQALVWTEKAYEVTKKRNIRMDNGYVLFHLVKMALDTGARRYHEFMNDYIEFRNAAPNNMDSNHDALLSILLDSQSSKIKLVSITENIDEAGGPIASHYFSLRALDTLQMNDGEYSDAERNFRRSIVKASVNNWLFAKLQSYQYLYKIGTLTENPDLKLESLEQILDLREMINNERFEREIARMQVAYNTREKELQLEVARHDKNILISVMFSLSLIVLLLAGIIYQKKRSGRILEEKNILIEKALAEKNILLKEIHHRVKNNLQMVSSLLQLQSRYITEPEAVEALNEGDNRVKSMAIIHHHLYSSDDISTVNVPGYIDNLCENILSSYNYSGIDIIIHKEIADITLDVAVMIPIGLILNELITNSFKYAFRNRTCGNIYISVSEKDSELMVCVNDDGVGYDPSQNHSGFGTRMINAFLRKLDAESETVIDSGTKVTIRTKQYKKEAIQKLSA